MLLCASVASLASACGSTDSGSESPPQGALENRTYVISRNSDQLFVADLQTLTGVGSVNTRVGDGANGNHMAMVSSDGRKVYVTATDKNALVVVDAETLSVRKTLQLQEHPTHSALCPGCAASGADELWVVNEGGRLPLEGEAAPEAGKLRPGAISIIDMTTDEVTQTLSDPSLMVPHFVRFSSGLAYVPSIGGNQITVFDLATRQVSDVLLRPGVAQPSACSGDPCGFADAQIDSNGLLISAHIETGSVLVYDTVTRQRRADILTGNRPWSVFVDVASDQFDTQLMPNWGDASVSLLDRKHLSEVARSLEGDRESYGVNYSPRAPGEAFVLNRIKERVAVIDRQTGAPIAALAVGGTTETASTTADGKYLLLPISSRNMFTVWDVVQREEVMRFDNVGEYPWSVTTIGGQNYCH
jgi:YVTN family beta-propeller protein